MVSSLTQIACTFPLLLNFVLKSCTLTTIVTFPVHLGMDKTEELTSRSFFWTDLQQDVRHYVRSCEHCQRNKPSNRRPGGLLQPILIP
jgi:hypothetical protein